MIFWSLFDYCMLSSLKLKPIYCLHILNNQCTLIVGSRLDIRFYGLETLSTVKILNNKDNGARCIALTSDEQVLVSGCLDYSIITWNLQSNQIISRLSGHNGEINSLVLTSDDRFIVSVSDDQTVRMWNRLDCIQVNQFYDHKSQVISILKANDKFLTISADSSMGQLDLLNAKLQVNCLMRPFDTEFLSFSHDSRLVCYVSENQACVWDSYCEADRNVLIGHKGKVKFVEISRDGRWAVTGSTGS